MSAHVLVTQADVTEYTSWCPRERRAVSRHRVHESHLAVVMLARACYVATHGGLPVWQPGEGLRTTYPKKQRAA